MRHKHGRARNERRKDNVDVIKPRTSTGDTMKNVGIVPLRCHNMKPKKKEPRRRQENEKRKEDKNEDPHRGQLAPTHAEKLSHYFKSDELVELRNIVQSSDLSDVPLLLAAVMLGKFDVVKRLFKEGAPIDSQGPEHTTPLMWAVKHKNMEMIDLLIRRNANITLEDDRGDNAILLAMQASDWDQDSFLDFWNSVKECEAFDLNHANKCGYTMLHYATKNQWENVLNYLLAQEVNVNCQTNKGVTPLMMAASRNHSQFVKAILNAKADVGVEDERSCTALCYIIAFVVQKHLELPNPTLEALMNTIENSRTQMSLEMYLKRRLDVLLKPPDTGSNYADVISTIIHPIFVFFVRFTKTGIELLLEQRVFARLAEAIEAHLDDPDLVHALLGLMLELLRYCQCCYGGGQCPYSERQIMDLFVEQGGANVCVMILKIYNNMVTNKWLLVAALMPLLTACTTEGKPREWLEAHFKEILPYYNNFLGMCLVKFNISADEYHMALLRKRAKEFRKLMSKLERGESICKQNEEPVIETCPEPEHFIVEPESALVEEKNYLGDLENTMPEHEYCMSEQEQYAMDQDYYIADQENYYVEQENNLSEQDYYAMDQEYALAQQDGNSVVPQDYSMVEQDNYVESQENFITDPEHSVCSITSAQNITMSSNSMDDISDPEMANVHSFSYPKKVRRKVAKTLKAKVSTFKEFEYIDSSYYIDRTGSQNDYHQSFERNEHDGNNVSHLERISNFTKPYCNSENIIIDVTDSQSNIPSYTSDGNYDINSGQCDGTEDYIPLDTSKYPTKIIDKMHCKNIQVESTQKPSDAIHLSHFSELSNDLYISSGKDENASGDVSKRMHCDINDKETTTLFTTVDNHRRNNLRCVSYSNDASSNYNESVSFELNSSLDKEHCNFENDNLLSASEKLHDTQNNNVESISTLDILFKKLLIKYVKSWQYEHDNNYPGHCGGGDGMSSEKHTDENFKKLKPFLSRLEKNYIVCLKSVWVSFKEKLLETESVDLYKDIASQVLELIRMHDKKLDAKIRHIDEYIHKQMQSESDVSATVSNTDSKETISSMSRAHSIADSDGHSDETRSYLKDMEEEENPLHPMQFKYLSGVNCPLTIHNTLDDSLGVCWESQNQSLYNHSNLDGQEISSVTKKENNDLSKLMSRHIEGISVKTGVLSLETDSDTLDNIRVHELNVEKVCNSVPCIKDDSNNKEAMKNPPANNTSQADDKNQPKKLSFAELFKDPSISLAITSQGAAINTNVPNAQSSKLPRFPTAAFITMGNNEGRANNVDGHHPQFVHPPPGFPAHPLLSLESLLRLQTDVNNGHGLRQVPPLPVYISLPDALLCPEKIAVFTSGRAMDTASVNPDITQLAPLVMFPGVPNYASRWKFLISVLQNIPPTYCQWCLDGVTMKRISLFDGPLKLPGGGNFGDVFFGLSDNKNPLAAKVMYINPSNSSPTVGILLQKLVNPLLKLRHEHILSYIQCVHHEFKLFLISPLCECNLGEYLMCLKLHNKLEYRSAELVKQLLLGLNFLHTLPLPIIHGNLKPSNVLLDEHGTLKLADFGLHPILYQVLPPPSSSIIWWSRETHDIYKQKSNLHCTFKSDIQVAGMMIHFIMTGGLHPFGAEAQEIIENVCKGRIKLKTLSCDINDLISWMMVFDPKSRPTILEVMSHVYFWDVSKKWNFVLGCCGIDSEGQALPIPLTEFHSTLDLKATEDNVKGDWVSIVKPAFPDMDPVEASSTDTPTGLLRFIRTCVEEHTEKKSSTIPHNLQNFFLSAFPALTLSLYRLVEETEWRKHPVMANLLKGNEQ